MEADEEFPEVQLEELLDEMTLSEKELPDEDEDM